MRCHLRQPFFSVYEHTMRPTILFPLFADVTVLNGVGDRVKEAAHSYQRPSIYPTDQFN